MGKEAVRKFRKLVENQVEMLILPDEMSKAATRKAFQIEDWDIPSGQYSTSRSINLHTRPFGAHFDD